MIVATSSEQARLSRRRNESNVNRLDVSGAASASTRTTYIGLTPRDMKGKPVPDPDALSPMAFLIEEEAHSVLNAHFHKADQFQIFVKGGGTLGNHPINSLCIQYTGACSPYGPIIAGPEGLNYFTLRNTYTAKAYFMPASRDELRAEKRQHREVFGDVAPPQPEEALAAASTVETSTVIAQEPDGMGAWRYVVPAGETVAGPLPADGGGQFWMVLSGELADPEKGLMPTTSCVFVSSDEAPYAAVAGPKGLDILVAQFPVKAYT